MAKKGKMLNGRQLYWLILEQLKRPDVDGSIMEFSDLLALEFKPDNLSNFMHDWKSTILGMNQDTFDLVSRNNDAILETLFEKQIKKSKQFEKKYELYKMDIEQKGAEKSYKKLCKIVELHLKNRRKDKNREDHESRGERRWGNGTGAPGAEVVWQNGDCKQYFKTGRCSRENDCPWNHDRTKGKGKGKNGQGERKIHS